MGAVVQQGNVHDMHNMMGAVVQGNVHGSHIIIYHVMHIIIIITIRCATVYA